MIAGVLILCVLFTSISALLAGDIRENIVYAHNSSDNELKKRGIHEEVPLFHVVNDLKGSDYFTSPPYYPTRSYYLGLGKLVAKFDTNYCSGWWPVR